MDKNIEFKVHEKDIFKAIGISEERVIVLKNIQLDLSSINTPAMHFKRVYENKELNTIEKMALIVFITNLAFGGNNNPDGIENFYN